MSFLLSWRSQTVQFLTQHVGVVAEICVDDAVGQLEDPNETMSATGYLRFLRTLFQEMPADVDRLGICAALRTEMLRDYGFPGRDSRGRPSRLQATFKQAPIVAPEILALGRSAHTAPAPAPATRRPAPFPGLAAHDSSAAAVAAAPVE